MENVQEQKANLEKNTPWNLGSASHWASEVPYKPSQKKSKWCRFPLHIQLSLSATMYSPGTQWFIERQDPYQGHWQHCFTFQKQPSLSLGLVTSVFSLLCRTSHKVTRHLFVCPCSLAGSVQATCPSIASIGSNSSGPSTDWNLTWCHLLTMCQQGSRLATLLNISMSLSAVLHC